jgi:hypothetical protein
MRRLAEDTDSVAHLGELDGREVMESETPTLVNIMEKAGRLEFSIRVFGYVFVSGFGRTVGTFVGITVGITLQYCAHSFSSESQTRD